MDEGKPGTPEGPELQTKLSKERTALSTGRTRLSLERTLMSWVRTAASLISFGFTIYKFFDEMQSPNGPPRSGSRHFALAMIVTGLLSLLLASIQHCHNVRQLRKGYPPGGFSLALVVALLVSGLGIFGLLIVLLRV